LRLSFISTVHFYTALAIYPPTGASNPHSVGLHDLATHKTYGTIYRYIIR